MLGHTLGEGVPKEAGAKAYHLDLARRRGLAVPAGIAYVVDSSEPATLKQIEFDVLRHLDGNSFAVRSSFRGEDSATESQAGRYLSLLKVPGDQLADALAKVFSSAGTGEAAAQGIVVQEMVGAEAAGVMFVQPDFLDPLVSWVDGLADQLVGGEEAGTTEELGPLVQGSKRRWRSLAQAVTRAFEAKELGWDVEWADDGHTTWLVQARPVTRKVQRDELFSYANIREIMPDPPSVFMASVVESAGSRLYEYYRNFDPKLPANRPLIELHLGRPLFNISLLCETMRHWGLPTRLVTDQIGGADVARAPFSLSRFLGSWLPISKQGLAQFSAVSRCQRETKKLEQFVVANSLGQIAQQTSALFEKLVTVMLDLTAAMAVPLTLLRAGGVLQEHSKNHQTPTGQILRSLEPLRELVAEHPEWKETLASGHPPQDPRFEKLWVEYLERFGHRGFFESDLAEPRFVEVPETILASLTAPSMPTPASDSTLRGKLTLPLWWYTRRVLDTREHWRNAAIQVYGRLRRSILEKAERLGFEEPNSVFKLTMSEWEKLDQGWLPDQEFLAARDLEIADRKRYNVPDLCHRFESRKDWLTTTSAGELDRMVSGISLSQGSVEGRVWLAEDARSLLEFEGDEPIVLVVRTVDPGWLFALPKIAGAIVELGGDLSHGSILLREFGVPAITNASGATQVFQTGDQVRLVAGEGYAVRLSR